MIQEFDGGKYTVIFDEKTGSLQALRYGEPWQDLSGNKMVYCMLSRVEELAEQRAELLGALKKCRFDSLNQSLGEWREIQAVVAKCESTK